MLSTLFKNNNYSSPKSLVDEIFNYNLYPSLFYNKKPVSPSVNIAENKKEYLIDIALPGLDKKDIRISANGNILTISGNKSSKKTGKKEDFIKKEFDYHSFSKSFNLPKGTDIAKITASGKDGILKICIPKPEATAEKKKDVLIK